METRKEYEMGVAYLEGKGVEQNYGEALKWFRMAAAQNDSNAMNYIGYFYHEGFGVLQNPSVAFDWYMKAAVLGNEYAQYNVGLMYREGDGVAVDDEKAMEWFTKSAKQNYAEARYMLEHCYRRAADNDGKYTNNDDDKCEVEQKEERFDEERVTKDNSKLVKATLITVILLLMSGLLGFISVFYLIRLSNAQKTDDVALVDECYRRIKMVFLVFLVFVLIAAVIIGYICWVFD